MLLGTHSDFLGSLKWRPKSNIFCGLLIYFEEVIAGEIEKASVTAGAFLLSRPVWDKTRVKTLGMRHKGLREHFSTRAGLSTAEHLNCLLAFPGVFKYTAIKLASMQFLRESGLFGLHLWFFDKGKRPWSKKFKFCKIWVSIEKRNASGFLWLFSFLRWKPWHEGK